MAFSLEQYRSGCYERNTTMKDILIKRIERQRKRSLGVLIKNGNRLPAHLIIEILSLLPVKTLLQLKTVSKSWYAMIKSSHFISKHLKNYYDNDENWRDCLIVQYSVTQAGELNVYELLMNDKRNRALSYQAIDTPIYNTYLCGPCDGIYYQWCFCYSAPKRSLWNPALNELKALPDITWKPNLPPDATYIRESYGFGYDSKTNDYKVILIMGYSDTRDEYSRMTDNPISILIYSLRCNSWRYWGDVDNSYDLERNRSNVFINGCYYWLGSRLLDYGWHYEMIISFDFSADAYEEIPLPQFENRPDYGSQLVVFHDSIAFVSVPNDNKNFCVWSWSEGIWTQKLSMKLDFRVRGAFSHWRDDMLVFRKENGKLILCDTNTKEIFVVDDPQAGGCENICVYKESLVSVNDFEKGSKHKGKKN